MQCDFAPYSVNLVRWIKLDETSGSTATDSSSNSNGSYVNATLGKPGVFGTSVSFNGATTKINSMGVPVTGSAARSEAAWIKTSNYSNFQIISSYGSTSDGEIFRWELNTAGKLKLNTKSQGYGACDIVVATNKWVHVAVTMPSGGAGLKLYVNGVQCGDSVNVTLNTGSGKGIHMGRSPWSGFSGRNFGGNIDDFRFYDIELSAEQIRDLYEQGSYQ